RAYKRHMKGVTAFTPFSYPGSYNPSGFGTDACLMGLEIVVLAAGQGTRMRSKLPKVLHRLAGEPLLAHVLRAARAQSPNRIHVVIGHAADAVRAEFADARDVRWVPQALQLGTGHAVAQALPGIDPNAYVLVLYGDVPLISKKTLDAALANAGEGVAIVTAHATRPGRLGRIVRGKSNAIERIVEAVDATPTELAIDEINSGILCARARL